MKRPAWAQKTPAMQEYYDHDWGFPVHDDRRLFQMLSLEIFQAGLSWETIWKRHLAFEKAFDNFEIAVVANYTLDDINRLTQDQTIIRNRQKIAATINNAQVIMKLQQAQTSFDDYIWSFVQHKAQRLAIVADEQLPAQTLDSQKIAKQMKKDGFKFIGPTIIYSFMTAVGLVNARLE